MANDKPTLKETTNRGEQRRNPRFPNSTAWSEERRRGHREERDTVIEEAGLVTDRLLDQEAEPDA